MGKKLKSLSSLTFLVRNAIFFQLYLTTYRSGKSLLPHRGTCLDMAKLFGIAYIEWLNSTAEHIKPITLFLDSQGARSGGFPIVYPYPLICTWNVPQFLVSII